MVAHVTQMQAQRLHTLYTHHEKAFLALVDDVSNESAEVAGYEADEYASRGAVRDEACGELRATMQ